MMNNRKLNISFDKKLNQKFYNISKTKEKETSINKFTNHLDMITYKRICSYAIKREFFNYIITQFYYSSVRKELSKYLQHGDTTILKHCINVAYFSFIISNMLQKKFNIKFNYEDLIVSAFLHDFFMYDWHEKSSTHRLHGFSHPKIASKNAEKLCKIDIKKQAIIETHMWPLTITKIPKSREAFLVCLTDKYAAILETFKIRF